MRQRYRDYEKTGTLMKIRREEELFVRLDWLNKECENPNSFSHHYLD